MPKRRPDHIPARTCAVCRISRPKGEMMRIVRSADGSITPDPTGRRPGRGTYICTDPSCRDLDRATSAIQRALGAGIEPGALTFEVTNAPK